MVPDETVTVESVEEPDIVAPLVLLIKVQLYVGLLQPDAEVLKVAEVPGHTLPPGPPETVQADGQHPVGGLSVKASMSVLQLLTSFSSKV